MAGYMRSAKLAVVLLSLGACAPDAPSSASSPSLPPTASQAVGAPPSAAMQPAPGTAVAGQMAIAVPPAQSAMPGAEFPSSPDSTPAAAGSPAMNQTMPDFCGVLTVMQSSCQACHGATPVAGAPMPLVTYEDFMKPAPSDPARKVFQIVRERTHDLKRPMPPAGVLPQATLSVLDSWIAAGALQPSAACPVTTTPATATGEAAAMPWPPADCEDVYRIVAHDPNDKTKPYLVPANAEEHPQFSYDAPWGDDDVQLLATRPITQDPAIVHHWILWDALERANLTFWAPGAGGDVLPPDVGLYMPKGPGSLGLDMHYFNLNSSEAKPDQSGVELCITRTFRPKTAAIYGLRGNATVAAMQRAENPMPCTVTATSDVHFLGITPHMHQLGIHAHLELERGGETNVIYDAPYNFEEQTLKPLDDILVKNADVLTTTCTYQNDTPRDVAWGDSTQDEMCFNWMRYYPRGAFQCVPANLGGGRVPGLPPGLPLPGTP